MTVWGVVGSKQIRGGAQKYQQRNERTIFGHHFFSKLRYINTLVVRFSIFSENSLILFYVVKCNIIYGTTNLCYLHFLAHSGGSGIFRFFVYKKITSKE